MCVSPLSIVFFFFNDTATTEIYTLSLHDALPIYARSGGGAGRAGVSRRAGPLPGGLLPAEGRDDAARGGHGGGPPARGGLCRGHRPPRAGAGAGGGGGGGAPPRGGGGARRGGRRAGT